MESTRIKTDDVRRLREGISTIIRLRQISFRDLERRLGLSVGYLTRILGGGVRFRLDHLLGLCQLLDIPPGLLLEAFHPVPASDDARRIIRVAMEFHSVSPSPDRSDDPEDASRSREDA